MSILLAESMNPIHRAAAASATTAVAMDNSQTIFLVFLIWAVAGLGVALLLGAFERKSIVGPNRLPADESAWDLILFLSAGFFAGFTANVILMGLIHAAPMVKLLLLEAAGDLATFFTAVLLIRRMHPGALKRLGLDPRRLTAGFAGGAATLFVLFPLIQLTSELVELIFDSFHISKAKPHEILQLLGKSQDRRLTMFAIFLAVVVAPLTEELLYRGLLQTSLTRLLNWLWNRDLASLAAPAIPALPVNKRDAALQVSYNAMAKKTLPIPGAAVRWTAVVISSLVFAAIHIEPAFLAPIFVLALGLGYAYERTGNLWLTITAHALFNTAQIVLYLAAGR